MKYLITHENNSWLTDHKEDIYSLKAKITINGEEIELDVSPWDLDIEVKEVKKLKFTNHPKLSGYHLLKSGELVHESSINQPVSVNGFTEFNHIGATTLYAVGGEIDLDGEITIKLTNNK